MSAASSPTFVRCPECGERLGVRASDAGKKARCGTCGVVFVIDAEAASDGGKEEGRAKPQAAAPRPALEDEGPATVTFACSLCDTRITAATRNVGKKVKCPDCGRLNAIPPPPKPKAKSVPAAMEGEQIELLPLDARTWDEQQSSPAAPTLHPVECKLCGTLMYATDEQIGRELKCPDCGALTSARRAEPKKKPTLPALVGAEYQLDPASKPTKRYVPLPIALRDAELHSHARATTVGPDGRLIVKKEQDFERPVRPKIPLITGVWRMLFTQDVIARWILTSISFGFAGWFLFSGLAPAVGSVVQGIMGIFMTAFGAALTVAWLTLAAPTFLTIISESAEGHDRLHDAPTWSPLEWMGEAFQLAAAIGAAGLAGALSSWVAMWAFDKAGTPLPWEAVAAVSVAMPLLVFPLALLGTLLENTPLGVISPRVLTTLFKCPGPWLLFYVESVVLVAAAAAVGAAALLAGRAGLLALPLIAMGAAVVYMRLLGRLAWWISDATAVEDDEEFHDESAAAHPHLAAARRAEHERRRRGEAE